MDFPTQASLFDRGAKQILISQGLLTSASVRRQGSDANIVVAGSAAMGDQLSFVLKRMWQAMFFSTAIGGDLDRLALDRYGLIRKPASSALGTVQLSVAPASAPPSSFSIPQGTIFASTAGQQFQSTSLILWTAGSPTSPAIPVASVLSGANQQAATGTIAQLISSVLNMPAGVVCANATATAGAADAETDDQFRARCLSFPQSLLQGTLAAITQAALAVPGVITASAIEVLDFTGSQCGIVQLAISDAFTQVLSNLNVNPPTYQTQSQQLANQVQANLVGARAAGVYVQAFVAQVVLQPIVFALGFQAGADVNATTLAASVAIANYTNALVPGALWTPQGAAALAQATPGVLENSIVIISPAGSVQPTAQQVIRTSPGLVTAAQQGTAS